MEERVVATAQGIPVLPGSVVCQLPGCTLPVYISQDGKRYGFCCRAHGVRAKNLNSEASRAVCKLSGCNEPVWVNGDGTMFEFCSRTHGREYAALQGAEGGETSGFTEDHGLFCAREGCHKPVKPPHTGASGGCMGRGPTRYNFCCRQCKTTHGVGEGSIPYSTTVPLNRAWYRDVMERAVEDAVQAMEQSEGGSGVESAAGSQDESARFSPPPLSALSPEVISSVMRCQALMKRQMANRARPYEAQYNGRRKCPICSRPFRIGEGMVKCYVDPDPDCVWVHVLCAQAIVSAKGGRLLHPSLV
mmetsp:Transcript_62469/g.129770  ORF Transcript_62469/g.129770 Transcript_62469/m.129770 type:complete len:303 (+) Transcript_62469:1615-2523(+)